MTASRSSTLALVVYRRGLQEQSRLITDCLAPAAAELRSEGLRLFWFDRYDARGPHVCALYTLPPERMDAARFLLAARVEAHLKAHPDQTEMTEDELWERHRACRGTTLCAIDARQGLGTRDSYDFCEHPADGYPFSLGRSLAEPGQLWELQDDLTRWVVEQLSRHRDAPPTGVAAHWVASLFHLLPVHHSEAEEYWWYHASTMIRGLRRPMTIESLTRTLGARNDRTFSRIWEQTRSAPPPWPRLPRLLELVASAGEPPRVHALLREIVHGTLRQLGIPAKWEVPLLLFACKASLLEKSGRV